MIVPDRFLAWMRWKYLSNKGKIVNILKGIIVFFIFFTIAMMFDVPFEDIFKFFLNISFFLWLPFSIFYFAFTKKAQDRQAILNMWKTYFAVIAFLFISMISIDNYVRKYKIDFLKTKLMYEIKTSHNASIEKDILEKIEDIAIKDFLFLYRDYNQERPKNMFNGDKNINNKKVYFVHNFFAELMSIVTLFMLLWSLSELSFFSDKYSEKNRKRKI